MNQNIEIPQALYDRLATHTKGFDTPASVIERLLNFYEQHNVQSDASTTTHPHVSETSTSTSPVVREYGKLQIEFFPPDLRQFKAFLLTSKQAWVLLHRSDGTKDLHQWNASRFTEKSDVLGNLRSGYLRGWREKGIIKAEVAIEKNELSTL